MWTNAALDLLRRTRRTRSCSAFLLTLLTATTALAQTAPAAVRQATPVRGGAELFSGTCKVCHGDAAIGGVGPALRGDKFTSRFVRDVVAEGRPGTMMPSFKTRFTPAQMNQVAAYVASLQTPRGPAPAGLRGDPAAGEQVFYSSGHTRCAGCHSIGGRGGRVGPDLHAKAAGMAPRELFQRIIVVPHQSHDNNYVITKVRTRGGQLLTGILAGETGNVVHFYDTSTLPPVLMNIPKQEIVESSRQTGTVMPADYAARLSLQQLLDVVAFLKSSSGSPTAVTLQDVVK
jgi:putative heme-binding domain-containing protein